MTDLPQPPAETFGAPVVEARPDSLNALNLLSGVLAGALGAIVASVIWVLVVIVTQYQLGIVAVAVGFVVGWATLFGAGKKRSVVLAILSAVFTLLAMALSEYFIVRHFAIQQLAAEGYTGEVALFLPLNDTLDIIGSSLGENSMTLLFWGIALFEAFVIPFRGGMRR